MSQKIEIYPLNRVEGDLEIKVTLQDNVIMDAKSAGTMYRGFENFLIGRAVLDGLVITPRVCGICSTSHLHAAAKALDMLYNVKIPINAVRIREITQLVEILQNDFRHAFLLYMPDFINPAYKQNRLYGEMVERYRPLQGASTKKAIDETRKILEIIAILGGQWPHSSFMVPGGVVSMPSTNELNRCGYLLTNFQRWYEDQVLGCPIEEWRTVQNEKELMSWLDSSPRHHQSDLGRYIRFSSSIDLMRSGKGHGNFISYSVSYRSGSACDNSESSEDLYAGGGFYHNHQLLPLEHEEIKEDVSHSWFLDGEKVQHPYDGKSQPYATGSEDRRYSWAKAPRYAGMPAETGPLAEMIMVSDPLITDLLERYGPSAYLRELSRLIRAARIIPFLEKCIQDVASAKGKFYQDHKRPTNRKGHGLVNAPRGALGHWLRIEEDRIASYQIITPTAWNASPRDNKGIRGPWEEALIGTEIKDPANPVEIHHIVRSFDPCLVCTVHTVDLRNSPSSSNVYTGI